MFQGHQADSARRKQPVIKELNAAREAGRDLSLSAIARAAGVDRTFLYRHPDLLTQLHAAQAAPNAERRGRSASDNGVAESRPPERSGPHRPACKRLERKLSELLGESAWRESGLGAPADIDHLQRQVTTLEQQVFGLRAEIEERDQELKAGRAAIGNCSPI